MSKYDVCKKCSEEAVHSARGYVEVLYGDYEDNEGNESIYGDKYTDYDGDRILVDAHVCFECGFYEKDSVLVELYQSKEKELEYLRWFYENIGIDSDELDLLEYRFRSETGKQLPAGYGGEDA